MRSFTIGAARITFTDTINNGFRKVLVETQDDGRPAAVDWQPKRSRCTRKEAAAFARKHGEYGGAELLEIRIETYVNISMF